MINIECVTKEQVEFVVNMTSGHENKVDVLDEALDAYRNLGEVDGYELVGEMAEEICKIIGSSSVEEISDFINRCYDMVGVSVDGQ